MLVVEQVRVQYHKMTHEEKLDEMFIQRTIDWVTKKCSLPFQLPPESVEMIIAHRAMEYYDLSDKSKIKNYYVVKSSDIVKNSINNLVQLPEQIYEVVSVIKTQGGGTRGARGEFSTESLFLRNSFAFGGAYGFGESNDDFVNGVVTMYEYSTLQNIISYPISFNYNRHASLLSLNGEYRGGDLVLEVWERLKLMHLYNDPQFFNYVVALIKKELATIYETFDLQYIGGVKPNFAKWADDGEKEEEKVEQFHLSRRSNTLLKTFLSL